MHFHSMGAARAAQTLMSSSEPSKLCEGQAKGKIQDLKEWLVRGPFWSLHAQTGPVHHSLLLSGVVSQGTALEINQAVVLVNMHTVQLEENIPQFFDVAPWPPKGLDLGKFLIYSSIAINI